MYPKRSLPLSTAVVFTMGRSRTPVRDMAGEVFDSAKDYGIPVPRMDGSGAIAKIQRTASAAGSIVIDKCRSRISARTPVPAQYSQLYPGRMVRGPMTRGLHHLSLPPNSPHRTA